MRSYLAALAVAMAVFLAVSCAQSTQLPATWTGSVACTVGTCTGTAPVIADAGMSMAFVDSFRLGICALAGDTIQGAGTMQAIWGDSRTQLPFRNSGLDQTVSVSSSQCVTFPDFRVGEITVEPDYVYFNPSGVIVSDGGTLNIYLYPHRGQ